MHLSLIYALEVFEVPCGFYMYKTLELECLRIHWVRGCCTKPQSCSIRLSRNTLVSCLSRNKSSSRGGRGEPATVDANRSLSNQRKEKFYFVLIRAV